MAWKNWKTSAPSGAPPLYAAADARQAELVAHRAQRDEASQQRAPAAADRRPAVAEARGSRRRSPTPIPQPKALRLSQPGLADADLDLG